MEERSKANVVRPTRAPASASSGLRPSARCAEVGRARHVRACAPPPKYWCSSTCARGPVRAFAPRSRSNPVKGCAHRAPSRITGAARPPCPSTTGVRACWVHAAVCRGRASARARTPRRASARGGAVAWLLGGLMTPQKFAAVERRQSCEKAATMQLESSIAVLLRYPHKNFF